MFFPLSPLKVLRTKILEKSMAAFSLMVSYYLTRNESVIQCCFVKLNNLVLTHNKTRIENTFVPSQIPGITYTTAVVTQLDQLQTMTFIPSKK